MSFAEQAPRTEHPNPLRKYGGIGAVFTLVLLMVLGATGVVPESLGSFVLVGLLTGFFYSSALYIIGFFRNFDRDAYPVLLGILVIPVILVIAMLILRLL